MIHIRNYLYAIYSRFFSSMYAFNEYLKLMNNNDIFEFKINAGGYIIVQKCSCFYPKRHD